MRAKIKYIYTREKTYKIKVSSLKIRIKSRYSSKKTYKSIKEKAQITNNRNKRGKSLLILRTQRDNNYEQLS